MPGDYIASSETALLSEEDLPPPLVTRLIDHFEDFYASSLKIIPSKYRASIAPGDHGKEDFMYGALGNQDIMPDDIKMVLKEKMDILRRKGHKRISQRDFLLMNERISMLVGDNCEPTVTYD